MSNLTFTSQDAFNAAARKAGGETFAAEHLTVETFKAGKAAKLDLTIAGRDFKIGAVAKYALKRNIEPKPAKALAFALACADKKKPPQDAAKRDDALIFARDIAAMMTRTLNASAKSDALKGEAGSILRGMLTDFQNGIADIEKALAKG